MDKPTPSGGHRVPAPASRVRNGVACPPCGLCSLPRPGPFGGSCQAPGSGSRWRPCGRAAPSPEGPACTSGVGNVGAGGLEHAAGGGTGRRGRRLLGARPRSHQQAGQNSEKGEAGGRGRATTWSLPRGHWCLGDSWEPVFTGRAPLLCPGWTDQASCLWGRWAEGALGEVGPAAVPGWAWAPTVTPGVRPASP